MIFTPQNGRILVKPIVVKEKTTESGIILAEKDKVEPAMRGIVCHAGESGITVGKEVLYSKYGADEVEIDHEKYNVVSSTNVLGIF